MGYPGDFSYVQTKFVTNTYFEQYFTQSFQHKILKKLLNIKIVEHTQVKIEKKEKAIAA
jgi:hypothetical protein